MNPMPIPSRQQMIEAFWSSATAHLRREGPERIKVMLLNLAKWEAGDRSVPEPGGKARFEVRTWAATGILLDRVGKLDIPPIQAVQEDYLDKIAFLEGWFVQTETDMEDRKRIARWAVMGIEETQRQAKPS